MQPGMLHGLRPPPGQNGPPQMMAGVLPPPNPGSYAIPGQPPPPNLRKLAGYDD